MSSESEEHQKHERRQKLMDKLSEILEREMPSLTVDHDVKEVLCAFNAMSAQLFGMALYESDEDRDEVKDIAVIMGDCVRSQVVRAYDRGIKEPILKEERKKNVDEREERVKDKEETCH